MWLNRRYYQVNEDWQHCMCAILGLNFVRSNRLGGGGPNVILTRPLAVKRIGGDGNCLFRSLSYVLTGSQEQYHEVRTKICDHLVTIAHFMIGRHLPSHLGILAFISILKKHAWTVIMYGVPKLRC